MTDDEETREIIRQTVRETLSTMGMDVEDPHAMRRDLAALRDFRNTREKGKAAAIWALVTAAVSGAVAAIWQAIQGAAK